MNLDLKCKVFTPEKDFTHYSYQEKKLDEYFARKYIRLLIRMIRRYYRSVHIKVEEFKADLLISKGYRIYVKLREDSEEEYKTYRIFLNSEALEEIIFFESKTDFLIKELESTLGIEKTNNKI